MTAIREVPAHRFSGRDVLAGLSVALLLIPQALAYAELAGLPGHHGLYAAGLPLIAAALFASSPYLQTGPGALTGLLTLGALTPLATPGSHEYVGLAALLALVVGLVRVGLGLTRAGWISYLMSRPFLTGFLSAAAILIVASQIPAAFGTSPEGSGVLGRAWTTLTGPAAWEGASVVLTALTILVVVGARRLHPLVPGVLIAALAGLAFSVLSGYDGPTVGAVPEGLPTLSLGLPWARFPSLVLPGAVIAIVGFSEAASISRAFATEERQRWNPDRELLGQGVANLAAAVSGGFPVGGSFARSSVNRLAGARSRWSGLVTGLAVLVFLPVAGVLAPLPRAILAGIVIAAVWTFFRGRELVRLWGVSRPQTFVAWSTFALTLLMAPHIEQAVVLGLLISGVVHLWRERTPRVTERREGAVLHLELGGVLWFGSAAALEDEVLTRVADQPEVRRVVLHCSGVGRIDLTAAYALADMRDQLRTAGMALEVVNVPPHAQRVLRAVGLVEQTEPDRSAGAGTPQAPVS